MQRIYIDLGRVPHTPRAALSGDALPSIAVVLGTELDIGVHFFRNNTQEALAGSSTGKLTIKPIDDPDGVALFLDPTMTTSGEGAATVYKFSGVMSSNEIVADLGRLASKSYHCSIAWTEPTKAQAACLDFDIVVHNSSTRPEDTIPATTDARWEWIKDAAPEAAGFLHNDEAKTLAVDLTGIDAALAGKVPLSRTINGKPLSSNVTLTKGDIGLGNADDTTDLGKPISTLTQTALNGKENSQTAATKAEAEAGTETAIRKFSPARLKEAILALAPSGGASITTPRLIHVAKNGNDTTGNGSLATPYLTAQKAFDVANALVGTEGVAVISLGVCDPEESFGDIEVPSTGWPETISIRGVSREHSMLGNIVFIGTANVTVRSDKSFRMGNLDARGTNSETPGVPGGSVGILRASGLVCNSIYHYGGNGSEGTPGDPETPSGNGSDGGTCAQTFIFDCLVADSIGIACGQGGAAGPDNGGGVGTWGSSPGAAEPAKLSFVVCPALGIDAAFDYGNCSFGAIGTTGSPNDLGGNSTQGPI